MKNKFTLISALAILMGCGQNQNSKENSLQKTDDIKTSVVSTEETTTPISVNVDSLKQIITKEKERIENKVADLRKVSLPTANMREQIKQKWNTVDVYYEGENIVKIKTMPHEKITKRTEEFYFKDGHLILVYTEDHGEESKDKPMGKTYFFNNNAELTEVNNSHEKEYSIKNSDAERLLEEANEFLEIAKKK